MTDQLAHQAGPIFVTLATVLLYYGFILRVAVVKYSLDAEYKARGEKFDRYFGEDRRMLAADRMQLNMLEQLPPFVVLLWVTALFVGPMWATAGGVVYVASRALYPFAMGSRLGRGVRALLFLSTGPGYLVILYFTVVIAVATVRALVG